MKCCNSTNVIYKDVVIVGNGPSGIILSYMLSGNVPYLISDSHPDEMLSRRLKGSLGKSLIDEDLDYLSQGLEGRTTNPVSLLMDALLQPYADMGLELEPLVEFRKNGHQIEHIVLGKGPPGGSWHNMDPHILTLSLASWMALPGLKFRSRDTSEKRAYASTVARYYVEYVEKMGLGNNFRNSSTVVSVRALHDSETSVQTWQCTKTRPPKGPPENEQRSPTCFISNAISCLMNRKEKYRCKRSREAEKETFLDKKRNGKIIEKNSNWEVRTVDPSSGETTIYNCKYLILANGGSDAPNKLEIFEEPEWLCYDLRTLERKLEEYVSSRPAEQIDPVLIVGAGLSAADAVIAVRGRNVPVCHVFRNPSPDLSRQLPENLYPEYHKVNQMMIDGGKSYPLYTAYPEHNLTELEESPRVVKLNSTSGDDCKVHVSFVCVLIGSRPDLSFLGGDGEAPFLGVRRDLPVDCKSNPIDVDPLTYRVRNYENLFAVGPLAGDNFVRFLPGGALAVLAELYRRNNSR